MAQKPLRKPKLKVQKYLPSKNEGHLGDVLICQIAQGDFLATKTDNGWKTVRLSESQEYNINKVENLLVSNTSEFTENSEFLDKIKVRGSTTLSDTLSVTGTSTLTGDTKKPIGSKIYFDSDQSTSNNYITSDSSGSVKLFIDGNNSLALTSTGLSTSRSDSSSMGADNAGTPDLLLVNKTGHANLHIKSEDADGDYDPFIIYSWLQTGETNALKQWVTGMDTNDGRVFNFCYKSSTTQPLTPSTTDDTEVKMALTTGGALTTKGTITGFKLAATNTAAATSDTDKFLVIGESGATSEVRYRTGAEVRSDIGAGTSSVAALDDLSDVTYSSGDLTISSLDTIVASGTLKLKLGDGDQGAFNLHSDDASASQPSHLFGMELGNYSSIRLNERGGSSNSDYFDINVIEHGATTITTNDSAAAAANLTLDVDGDITLDAYGKQINFAFNGTTYALYDINADNFTIKNTTNVNDYFNINVGEEGATTLSTVDADTVAGHLTLDTDGDIILDAVCGNGKGIFLKNEGTTYGKFDIHHNATYFTLYENGGASTSDYMSLYVKEHGETYLLTTDAASNSANFVCHIDGDIMLNPYGGGDIKIYNDAGYNNVLQSFKGSSHYLAEQADALVDSAGFGQIWVHDDAPNSLYFTNDAGNDIQLTDGAYNVGQFGLIYQFGGYSRPNDTNHVYVPSYGGYYAHIADMGTVGTALGDTSAESYIANYRGYVCPKAMTLTNFNANVRLYNQANANVYACEFVVMKGTPADNSNSNITMTTVGIFSMSLDAENTNNVVNGTWDTSHDNIAAGDLLLVGIRRTEDDGDDDWNIGETYYNKYYLYFSYNIWGYIGV